jgi:hypothetical protein
MTPFPTQDQPPPFEFARNHLVRARNAARKSPVDWTDLTVYGFYCLELALKAAAEHLGAKISPNHLQKAELAKALAGAHNLPDVSALLLDLNEARKATGYGDVAIPRLDSDDLLAQLEGYVSAVGGLLDAHEKPG